jgi:CheY-like chemotaxis protein
VSQKLLLADASTTIRRVIELTFASEDVTVVAVGDGELAIARIPIERPDIILADIAMPKRNGYEVAAFVKGRPELRHIPVLLLAGAFEPVDTAKAEQAECDGVIVKPFEPQHVIARVRELLEARKGSPTDAATAPDASTVERPVAPWPRVESRPSAPVAPETRSVSSVDRSLDDYFDRLDAAFAAMETVPPPPLAPIVEFIEAPSALPTLDTVLDRGLDTVPDTALDTALAPADVRPPASPAAPAPPSESSPTTALADLFTMLFAAEQGEGDGSAPRLLQGSREPVVNDALVDEVARRVVEKLSADVPNGLIEQVVSDVAERLVREEIARIRNRQ